MLEVFTAGIMISKTLVCLDLAADFRNSVIGIVVRFSLRFLPSFIMTSARDKIVRYGSIGRADRISRQISSSFKVAVDFTSLRAHDSRDAL